MKSNFPFGMNEIFYILILKLVVGGMLCGAGRPEYVLKNCRQSRRP